MHPCEAQRLFLSEYLNVISQAATLSATFMALDTTISDDYSVIFMRAWGAASPLIAGQNCGVSRRTSFEKVLCLWSRLGLSALPSGLMCVLGLRHDIPHMLQSRGASSFVSNEILCVRCSRGRPRQLLPLVAIGHRTLGQEGWY